MDRRVTVQMDAGSLSALFQHTRTWGRAQRGLELFQFAADALSQYSGTLEWHVRGVRGRKRARLGWRQLRSLLLGRG
ncbi:hypothetical protein [Alicyclobacillus acidocaldarius]|uniref:hypothetical protein n=1 Tax=Alicyclobacillus acidocaldarius TaxID=405212 RepID=UPI00345EDB43